MHQSELLLLSHDEIMRLVEPAKAIELLAEGFKALTARAVQAPPRPKIDLPGHNFSLAMLAWMPGQMITLKSVSVFHGNIARGLESHQALITLYSAETGAPAAVLEGGSITGLRTAAAAILSVRLAAARTGIATIVGGGVQAREHARLLHHAGQFHELRIVARNAEAADQVARLAAPARDGGPAVVRTMTDTEAAVRGADVVCLTTSADTPVIEAGWVNAGAHVTSVGFAPPGSEVPRELVAKARILVEAKTAFEPAPVGCAELAGRDSTGAVELGEVISGAKPARTSADEITLYKSMGNAMEDLVVANLAYAEAKRLGVGRTVTV